MLRLALTEAQQTLAPIIVSSPTTRCGTTLVQRLLASSKNAFIYGEEIGLHVRNQSGWLFEMMAHLERNEERFGAEFQQALQGRLSDWRPGLPPPPQVLLQAYIDTFFQVPIALQAFGDSIGRPLWGFKCPGLSPETIRLLFALMPRAKIVYVIRELSDALRSAKARKFVNSGKEIEEFCTDWRDNLRGVLTQTDTQRVLLLRYRDLCAEPDASVIKLEAFTDARGVDAREFDIKVNTFVGEPAEGRSPTQYIEPAELSPDETRLAEECTRPVQALLSGLGPLATGKAKHR